MDYFEVCHLNFKYLEIFKNILLLWFSNLKQLWLEYILCKTSIFLWEHVVFQMNILHALENNMYSVEIFLNFKL